jgi:hypothetical protein
VTVIVLEVFVHTTPAVIVPAPFMSKLQIKVEPPQKSDFKFWLLHTLGNPTTKVAYWLAGIKLDVFKVIVS